MDAAKHQDEHKKDQSLSSMVYETLKQRIINGELLPGSVMMERTLAEDFKISRTPVREALKLLLQEGWIVWEERRKAVVSEIKESDVIELFKLRDMIEHFAIKSIIESGEPQVLAGSLVPITNEMEKLKDSPTEFMKKDMEFHSAIVDKLGITKLAPLWSKIYDDMMRLDVQSIYPKRDADLIVAEHRRLINAFWNGDVGEALECISEHCAQILKVYQLKHTAKKEN
ncbi:GntR family transcriptional regulator [Cloacibacillus evryensis]|uniref:GntR family transcriptional regulator n=1 Tax=Cloacibacillus evryensis TaxID=508460 RepID=UPI0004AE07D5|nr:GntR family transcriptional regulator [Cloacibacillus evryensis]MEA5036463.1 GntR family transcriptional regulator [Cloacibacillus evryensis]